MFEIVSGTVQRVALLSLATWIQIPFSPLPWNFFYIVSISLIHGVQGVKALNSILTWIVFGIVGWGWICPISSQVLAGPSGGYVWGVVPAVFWAQFCYEKTPWIKWVGALVIVEIFGAAQCVLLTPNINSAKQYGLLALFPWHLFQSLAGLLWDQRIKQSLSKLLSDFTYR